MIIKYLNTLSIEALLHDIVISRVFVSIISIYRGSTTCLIGYSGFILHEWFFIAWEAGTHTHTHTHTHTYTHTHKHARIHTQTRTHTHTNTHTDVHTKVISRNPATGQRAPGLKTQKVSRD